MNRMINRKNMGGRKVLTAIICLTLVISFSCIPINGIDMAYAEDTDIGSASSGAIENPVLDNSEDGLLQENSNSERQNSKKKVSLFALPDTTWYTSDKTATSFAIGTAPELLGLSDIVSSGETDFEGKTIKLTASFSLGITNPIEPIGTEINPFNGTFDGNNKIISDLYTETELKQNVGLFGKTGQDSLIKNLSLSGGTISVSEESATGEQIRYIGAIAGYMGGDIENCDSGANVVVSSKKTLGKGYGIIRDIGGLVGHLDGDMKSCERSDSSDVIISSTSDINEDVRYLIGGVGGLVGSQGDLEDVSKHPVIEDCNNKGEIKFDVTGKGGVDRFGAQLYSVSFAVGGIAGETSGSVLNSTNEAKINTSQYITIGGKTELEQGRGADGCGGIVGNLRGKTFEESVKPNSNGNSSKEDPAYKYFVANNGVAGMPSSVPPYSAIKDCTNTGEIIGLAAVGGIVGNAGTFTEIEGCANTNSIKGCRWNKPFTAGIVGNTQGDVRYCYNKGEVESVSGGGYYCAGLVGSLWSANTQITADNNRIPTTEMTGCFTVGQIITSSSGFRTGFLAGENEGFIHGNVYLGGISKDDTAVDTDNGTVGYNAKYDKAEDIKKSKAIGELNNYAAGKGNWDIFYLPDGTGANEKNEGFPVLSRTDMSVSGASAFPSSTSANTTASSISDASYSASNDPKPKLAVKVNGTELVENADYYIVPQSGAKAVTINETISNRPYKATIIGMGNYTGNFPEMVSYGIVKAQVSDCTIICDPAIFNWERQFPAGRTKLVDSAGVEIDPSEYTVGDLRNADGNPDGVDVDPSSARDIHYFDYINAHGATYKYDVVVTAKPSSPNYSGTTTQAAFKIKWASMMPQLPPTDPEYDSTLPERIEYDKLTWKGKTWDFLPAMRDKTGKYMEIEYTGSPIMPTLTRAKYLGRELRPCFDYDYQYNPLNYDFKYIYGNANPETDGGISRLPIEVTKGEPTCVTIRFTNGGNFDNFVPIFFRIVPADISRAKVTPAKSSYVVTGKKITPAFTVTLDGRTLKSGTDYTFSYSKNTNVGTAGITINGKGNYTGTHSKGSFKITKPTVAKTAKTKAKGQKKAIKFSWKKNSKATGYQIQYGTNKKITKGKKTVTIKKASTTSRTVKKLGKKKTYYYKVRSYKKIGSKTYYSKWSKVYKVKTK